MDEIIPLSSRDVLTRTLRILRGHGFVLLAVCTILSAGFRLSVVVLRELLTGSLATGLFPFVGVLLLPLAHLVASTMVLDIYVGALGARRNAWSRALRAWPAYVVTLLIGALTGVLLSFGAVLTNGVHDPALLLLRLRIWMFLLALVALYGVLIAPVMLVEREYTPKAILRSAALVGHAWRRTFALVVVVSLVPSAMIAIAYSALDAFSITGAVVIGVAEGILGTCLATMLVVLYIDLRTREEYFDLPLLLDQVSGQP